MTLPALVLVHGGAHAADCWDPTVDEVHRRAPDLPVLAVDLPGRAGKPGELAALSIGECRAPRCSTPSADRWAGTRGARPWLARFRSKCPASLRDWRSATV